jgi:hypothetical protein
MAAKKNVIGINKAIEAEATGAIAAFHCIEYFSVDLRSKLSTLVVNGYVSAEAQKAGKHNLTSTNVTIHAVPGDGESALDFFYRAVTAPAPEQAPADPLNPMPMLPQPTNIFSGAELVTE